MKQKTINAILFASVLLAILLAFIDFRPLVVSYSSYIGIIVTLLGLVTTFVIGYQIYNAIELRSSVIKLERKYDEIYKKEKSIIKFAEEQDASIQEGFDIINSLIKWQSGQSFIVCGESFRAMHHALISSLKTNRSDYEWIFLYLRKFISEFQSQTFSANCAKNGDVWYAEINCTLIPLKQCIEEYATPIKEDESMIRSSENFCKIKIEYNRVMKLFYKRLDEIGKDPIKMLSFEEIRRIINPS